ncbi:unnamed protein product [Cuscuta campestris]|uniref:F-box domain-containing protein n=1 Tax=Cuscuta campestris TaxID=132261 RepID=A0A484NAG8_9ASTE|nr:unnamed protein product [Cuscuta campestris]
MAKRQRLSNNFALKKCSKQEDRISQLPDDILVHILSFLNIKEAADTSVLSKRWLPLSRYVPRLDFDATAPLNQLCLNTKLRKMLRKKYVTWVNHTLCKCKVHRLDQFRVRFDINKSAQRDIEKWLEFSFARQVKRLELDLLRQGWCVRYSDRCYTFPDVHKLPPLLHNFKSLKVLSLKSINVTGEVLEFFLYSCPSLEEMVVLGSYTLVNLEVVGPSLKLKHLEIWECKSVKSLKICDTNLVTLRTSAGHKLLLFNVPMLIEVDICGLQPTRMLHELLPFASHVLSQLEVLKIHSFDGLECLEHYTVPVLPMLKKFVITVSARGDVTLLGCTNVIAAAPQLKEFECKLWWSKLLRSKRECRKVISRPLHNLKLVRLLGYYGRTSELELVRYFLENAVALEKIIVDPRNKIDLPAVFLRTIESEVQIGRDFAKLQLESEVPSHIELVIL